MTRAIEYYVPNPSDVKPTKNQLESLGVLNKALKITKKSTHFVIPLTGDTPVISSPYGWYDLPPPPNQTSAPPKKYSVYPPMVLINQPCNDYSWLPKGCTHVATNKPIIEDNNEMRLPFHLQPLVGDFGPEVTPQSRLCPEDADFDQAFWCSVVQNDIWQTWAPRYTMFSRGNIKEKARVLQFPNVASSVVVDLYCGIGYFSLSYLKRGAKVVGWDINPWSIEGFRRALVHNKISYRVIKPGDPFDANDIFNSEVQAFLFLELNEYAPMRLLRLLVSPSHINLGLLPTSRPLWHLVKQIGSDTTMVHVHENVQVGDIEKMGHQVALELGELVDTVRVKTFAPDVWHVVYDVKLK